MVVRLSTAIAVATLLSSSAFAQGEKLTDSQIAHIAYTAGKIDIAAAKQALERSKNKDVKAFATDMVRDHEAVNKQALALLKKLKVTPKDNETSRALARDAAAKSKARSKLNKGADFDQAYANDEVAYHKTVNNSLQTTLIPSASNAELKNLLQRGLMIFKGHEQHAEQVAAELK
jgi:putative membrane protein